MTTTPLHAFVHLRSEGVSVLLDCTRGRLPALAHWGADLGEVSAADALRLVEGGVHPIPQNIVDEPVRVALLPESWTGWAGRPGLSGSRGGRDWSPRFTTTALTVAGRAVESPGGDATVVAGGCALVEVAAVDDVARLRLLLLVELLPGGVLRSRARVTNLAATAYQLDDLVLAYPVPPVTRELLDLSGRWGRERSPQRRGFTVGVHLREGRRGRTGADAATVLHAGTPGFGFAHGEVWGVHTGWSGNHTHYAERLSTGEQMLGGGELLLPGEVVLARGESYATPWLYATWGVGLDDASARVHEYLRARPHHPTTPRPVTFNAWEAVYFDHSLDRLLRLVDVAAEAGAERFVLDDGWFGSRRDDTSGLGDWVVSGEVWPNGLAPLADAVHARGMEFGLWFEPEMVNLDSDAARAHPEWVLSPRTHRPQQARGQHVLDLTNPEAFAHVLGQMRTVLADTRIDFIKWDFNRDLYEAVSPLTGRPAYHAQTLATYRLMGTVLAEHPGLEIESCAGGGGRIDLGIMEMAVRVWASDCIDPLERQQIEAGTALLLPPELMGSHVASTTSHTTGRTLGLTVRASTAMFGHMGVEWNLLEASAEERADLAAWIALHKELRHLLHTGRVVHVDHPDAGWSVHGVVSADKDDAVFSLMRVATSPVRPGPAIALPGLDADADYRLEELLPDGVRSPVEYDPRFPESWAWWQEGVTLPGRILSGVGLRFPDLMPEHAVLVRLTRA